jgi:hypothetical protein
MRRYLLNPIVVIVFVIFVVVALSVLVYADVSFTNTGIVTSNPQVWPTLADGTAPAITTNPVYWNSNEGYNSYRSTVGGSFTVPANRDPHNCILQAIAFILSGTPTTSGFPIDDLRLIDLGTNGDPETYQYNVSPDLLPITNWLYPGGTMQVGLLSFTCGPHTNDTPTLIPGHTYSFEFVETRFHGTGFWLGRGPNLYAGGRGYQCSVTLDDSGNALPPGYGNETRTDFPAGHRDTLLAVYLTADPEYGRVADSANDCVVNLTDAKVMNDKWLTAGLVADIYPEGSPDSIVDFEDFALLAQNWLVEQPWP